MAAEQSERGDGCSDSGGQQQPTVRAVEQWGSELSGRYLGAMDAHSAGRRATAKGDMQLYHMTPPTDSVDLPTSLPLMVVYRTAFGQCHHYPVLRSGGGDASAPMLHIETGPDTPPMFKSVGGLVRFYTTYAYIMPDGESVELLPWWCMEHHEYVPGRSAFPSGDDWQRRANSRVNYDYKL